MIVLHVEVKKEDLALSVIQHLLKKQLIHSAEYTKINLFYPNSTKGEVKLSAGFAIRAKTKALQFQKIQTTLQDKFKKRIHALYATPIVYMDQKQAELLKSATQAV